MRAADPGVRPGGCGPYTGVSSGGTLGESGEPSVGASGGGTSGGFGDHSIGGSGGGSFDVD